MINQIFRILGIIITFAGTTLDAKASPDKKGWEEIAKKRQPALVTFAVSKEGSRRSRKYPGFFVSKDGHALCRLWMVSHKSTETLVVKASDGNWAQVKQVMALFPEYGMALVKTEFQPSKWLNIAKEQAPLGSDLAFIKLGRHAVFGTAEIVSRGKSHRLELTGAPFMPVMSLANTKIGQAPPRATPAIDENGNAHAVIRKPEVTERDKQVLTATSLEGLADKINDAIMADDQVVMTLPLANELNPYDPLMTGTEVYSMMGPLQNGDMERGLATISKLKNKYPGWASPWQLHEAMVLRHGDLLEKKALIKEISQGIEDGSLDPLPVINIKGSIEMEIDDLDAAIATFKQYVELAPEDFPDCRAKLAECYLRKAKLSNEMSDYQEAAIWYERALPAAYDDINMLKDYLTVLNRLKNEAKADQVEQRIQLLE